MRFKAAEARIPVFLQTGEAAGFAAALAKQQLPTTAELDADLLVRTLVERRQLVSAFRLPGSSNHGILGGQ